MVDVTVVVAGEAGQGVQSAGSVLTRLFFRAGYYVFAYPDVMSRIRGGHNFTRIRVSERPVHSISARMNVLLALDEFSARAHVRELVADGVVLKEGIGSSDQPAGQAQVVALPMQNLARKHGTSRALSGAVALGAVAGLVGQPVQALELVLAEEFGRKGGQVVKENIACAIEGYAAVSGRTGRECPCRIPVLQDKRRPVPGRMLLTGNQATALGALAAGLKFYAGYPMSPSTGIMEFLASRQKEFGLVVEQAEDEVSAINMVLGASYAGTRAMTATSGGGFALMVEALGLAGMTELPVVIVLCQRPGPATGFPTRTEQAELLYVLNASQDEFPRFVFAPGNAEQAAYCTARALDLARQFQVPAIVLSDQFLADSQWTVDGLRFGDRDVGTSSREQPQPAEPYSYMRYRLTESGVSPWLFPGTKNQLVCSPGSEHGEDGLPTEDAQVRVAMQDKRMRKFVGMSRSFGDLTCYPSDTENGIVLCYGSTLGVVKESVDELRRRGLDIGLIHLHEVWPFPGARVRARLARARRVVTVEHNATGQLGRLLRRETRLDSEQVLKYDGRPFSAVELTDRLTEVYKGRL